MPLLLADSLSLQYGGKIIFDDDSIAIDAGDRLGIVGANGTGKSTLMRILVGTVQPDGGRITRAKGSRIGYLAQEHGDPGEGGLLDSVMSTAPGRTALEERLADVEAALAKAETAGAQLELGEELADLHATLGDLDAHFARHEAERILTGLGFSVSDFSRPVRELSGGWRMRAALAALLYQRPDVLLLDEPTNHLDMPSVQWLSGFLDSFSHALVLISHDKEFLNKHIKRVASLEVEGLRIYRGNYDSYLVQREQELELLENRVKKDEARKKELEAFVERFRAKATKARQAQSRVRMIEKLQSEQVDIPKPRRSIVLTFQPAARAGDTVIDVKKLSYGYGERRIFDGLDLQARRGDRIAIVGVNGAGKTTLLKLLAGELEPDAGAIKLGHNVTPSYFAQHHADVLDLRKTVLEEVWRASPELSQTEARAICGAFLFSGDDVDKGVGVLSGGEKARVALARMLARPGNLLLLDEPTNHLDTDSADKLTASLEGYDGTLLFVSHNLDFARRLSNKVWDVHDGLVETYPGSLGDYLTHLDQVARERDAKSAEARGDRSAASARSAGQPAPVLDDKAARKDAYQKRKEQEAEARKKRTSLERRVQDAEKKIAELEKEQAELEATLADPATHADPERSKKLAHRYAEVKKLLEGEMARWEQATIELEAVLTAYPAE
ncbi:ATP-binding cassette domain-containing protein [Myxococcota bacterium]|nr:ATP-binding cassette domain-containing protein [Myxococcota bacterium]